MRADASLCERPPKRTESTPSLPRAHRNNSRQVHGENRRTAPDTAGQGLSCLALSGQDPRYTASRMSITNTRVEFGGTEPWALSL